MFAHENAIVNETRRVKMSYQAETLPTIMNERICNQSNNEDDDYTRRDD